MAGSNSKRELISREAMQRRDKKAGEYPNRKEFVQGSWGRTKLSTFKELKKKKKDL